MYVYMNYILNVCQCLCMLDARVYMCFLDIRNIHICIHNYTLLIQLHVLSGVTHKKKKDVLIIIIV